MFTKLKIPSLCNAYVTGKLPGKDIARIFL